MIILKNKKKKKKLTLTNLKISDTHSTIVLILNLVEFPKEIKIILCN